MSSVLHLAPPTARIGRPWVYQNDGFLFHYAGVVPEPMAGEVTAGEAVTTHSSPGDWRRRLPHACGCISQEGDLFVVLPSWASLCFET